MKSLTTEEYNSIIPNEYKSAFNDAVKAAEELKYNIYLIGGAVRDLILFDEKKIKDIDITVEGDAVLLAEKLQNEYGCELVSIQEQLRTAKVKFPCGQIMDFASTREEKYDLPGVLPSAYNFGCSLQNDILRRDFTINTLAVKLNDKDEKYLYDFCCGYEDIKKKQIRILHDNSFNDDPSRIVRAVKFQKRFNFNIEIKTHLLMQKYLNNVSDNIPLERIKNEFKDYFNINQPDLYEEIIKENIYKLVSNNPIFEIHEERIKEIKNFNLFKEDEIWFIYFAHLIINSNYAQNRLNLTSKENKVISQVKSLICTENTKFDNDINIYNIFKDKEDLSLAIYYVMTANTSVQKFCERLKAIKVLITGKDLIELGFQPSEIFSEIFNKIIEKKIKGEIRTKEEEIRYAQTYKIKEEQN